MSLRKVIEVLLLTWGVVNIWFQILLWLPANWHRTDHNRHMWLYFHAAGKAAAGLPLYRPIPDYSPLQEPIGFVNPPQLAVALIPFHGHFNIFCHVWYFVMLAALYTFAYSLARLAGDASIAGTLRAIAILCPSPWVWSYSTLSTGNVEPILWAMFGLASCGVQTAVFYPLMTILKPFAAWSWAIEALSAIRTGGMRALGSRSIVTGVLLFAAITLGSMAVTGPGQFVEWAHDVLPQFSQGTFSWTNFSLSMAVLRLLRLLGLWHFHGGPLPAGPRLFLSIVGICGPASTLWLTRALSTRARAIAVFLSALIFSPICWVYYLYYFLIPAALFIGRRRAVQPKS